jgi:hypothetical protein
VVGREVTLAADAAFALGLFAGGDVEVIGTSHHGPISLLTSDHRSYRIERSAAEVLSAAYHDGWRRGIAARMSCE